MTDDDHSIVFNDSNVRDPLHQSWMIAQIKNKKWGEIKSPYNRILIHPDGGVWLLSEDGKSFIRIPPGAGADITGITVTYGEDGPETD